MSCWHYHPKPDPPQNQHKKPLHHSVILQHNDVDQYSSDFIRKNDKLLFVNHVNHLSTLKPYFHLFNQTSYPNGNACTKSSLTWNETWESASDFWKPVPFSNKCCGIQAKAQGYFFLSHFYTKHRRRSVCSLWTTKSQKLKEGYITYMWFRVVLD